MAKWQYDRIKDITLCSNCGKIAPLCNEINVSDGDWESPFCPWCGAKMEKDDTNEVCGISRLPCIKCEPCCSNRICD